METFNPYQYKDLESRPGDPYASAKYGIILRALQGKKSLRILNAGCGAGDVSFLLAKAGHRVMGVDPEPSYIALAEKRRALHPSGSACEFIVRSIEEMPLSERFDCVIATDVIEHIDDDARAARHLASLLLPGGMLVITVPAMQWLFGAHDVELGHFRRYTKSSLRRLLAGTGLVSLESDRYFGWTLVPVCFLYSRLLRRPYPAVAADAPGGSASFVSRVARAVLSIDARTPSALGTSIISFSRRRAV